MKYLKLILDAITVETWEIVARATITMMVMFTFGKAVLDAGEALPWAFRYLVPGVLILWSVTPILKKIRRRIEEKEAEEILKREWGG